MTTKEIRIELLNEENRKDTLERHIETIKSACNKLKFMGRYIGVLKDLENAVRANSNMRNDEEITRCLAAIDRLLAF